MYYIWQSQIKLDSDVDTPNPFYYFAVWTINVPTSSSLLCGGWRKLQPTRCLSASDSQMLCTFFFLLSPLDFIPPSFHRADPRFHTRQACCDPAGQGSSVSSEMLSCTIHVPGLMQASHLRYFCPFHVAQTVYTLSSPGCHGNGMMSYDWMAEEDEPALWSSQWGCTVIICTSPVAYKAARRSHLNFTATWRISGFCLRSVFHCSREESSTGQNVQVRVRLCNRWPLVDVACYVTSGTVSCCETSAYLCVV